LKFQLTTIEHIAYHPQQLLTLGALFPLDLLAVEYCNSSQMSCQSFEMNMKHMDEWMVCSMVHQLKYIGQISNACSALLLYSVVHLFEVSVTQAGYLMIL
jgi:hypothetical protein